MGFPDDSLTSDEHVVLHLHPHWAAMIARSPASGPEDLPGARSSIPRNPRFHRPALPVALLLFLWLAFWPFVVWRSTHYVFTDERVLLREGVFNRQQRDIPLTRVNDVSSSQNLIDRLLGCGKLTVESAGERGQSVLNNIPKVVAVQKVVYELVEADHERRTVDDQDLRTALRDTLGHNDKT